jgi:hypothetical protein
MLGDFGGVSFEHKGVTSRFFMKDGRYFVETDGASGKPETFEVRYAVGHRPLQQYLVETTNGRLQVLDIAWDVTAKRWFHLYPDQELPAGDGMHWTGTYKNWQARCATCHQTGFDKGYDFATRTYKSHWSELTVGCETCHGPAKDHVEAARRGNPHQSLIPKHLRPLPCEARCLLAGAAEGRITLRRSLCAVAPHPRSLFRRRAAECRSLRARLLPAVQDEGEGCDLLQLP